MRAVVSGGGTAGHINPALALAGELEKRGWEVSYAGTPQGIEARLVPQAGLDFVPFKVTGFHRAHPLTLPKAVVSVLKSTRQARAWFAEKRPDVVIGFGGYVCMPVCRAAMQSGIPYIIHEQNSIMGLANKNLAANAARVCLTYAETKDAPTGDKVVVTGNPVRASVIEATRSAGREMLGIPEDATMLLVFGGSLGARHINQALGAMKEELLAVPDLYIVHITGPKEYDTVCAELALTEEEKLRWNVMGYQDRMGETLAAADAVVSRAGATSLAEIAALSIPALLIPYPHAVADHQTTNARAWVNEGCADMIPDAEVEGPEFREKVMALATDPVKRQAMHERALAQDAANAAADLADIVVDVAQKR